MKLNLRGKYLYEMWNAEYYRELAELKELKNDASFVEGTIIVENKIKTLEDEVGWCLLTYYDNAIDTVQDWIENGGESLGECGYTLLDVKNELVKCFESEDNMVQQINAGFWHEINGYLDEKMARAEFTIKSGIEYIKCKDVDFEEYGTEELEVIINTCKAIINAEEERSKLFGMLSELQSDVSCVY